MNLSKLLSVVFLIALTATPILSFRGHAKNSLDALNKFKFKHSAKIQAVIDDLMFLFDFDANKVPDCIVPQKEI